MNDSLKIESEKLTRSWMRHDASVLRDYLVADVEDPRLNVQSLLARHFLARALTGGRFADLMVEECRFATALNWCLSPSGPRRSPEEADLTLYALRRGLDNAEGIEIPEFILRTFSSLPRQLERCTIPNYLERWLTEISAAAGSAKAGASSLDTFICLWRSVLESEAWPKTSDSDPRGPDCPSVIEPACGSANDYRFLAASGLAERFNYTGFDLCPKNVANAQALFPGTRFQCANVFEIPAPDRSFDYCVVHDLFEHLSLEGLTVAIDEICRVTRRGLCLGFFNMDEIGEHREQPVGRVSLEHPEPGTDAGGRLRDGDLLGTRHRSAATWASSWAGAKPTTPTPTPSSSICPR